MVLFAVAVTLARPATLVTAVALDKVALAPLPGTAKVTVTPCTGRLAASFTMATNGLVNAVPATAVCGLPELTETPAPAVLVNAKFTAVATPVAVADTL